MDDFSERVVQVRALNAVDHTRSLAELDPSWGSEVTPFAGGWLVLAGAGMYTNMAMAVGIVGSFSSADMGFLVARSADPRP